MDFIFYPTWIRSVDHPLSEEQLHGSLVLNTIIRPLVNDYVKKSPAIIYSLLVNRLYFLRIQSSILSFHSINATRASLCEILATRVLDGMRNRRGLSKDEALLTLTNTLVRCFSPFQGAPAEIVPQIAAEELLEGQTSALESKPWLASVDSYLLNFFMLSVAIVSQAKLFIRALPVPRALTASNQIILPLGSPAVQQVVEGRFLSSPSLIV